MDSKTNSKTGIYFKFFGDTMLQMLSLDNSGVPYSLMVPPIGLRGSVDALVFSEIKSGQLMEIAGENWKVRRQGLNKMANFSRA